MTDMVGKNRVVILAILLIANVLFYAGDTYYVKKNAQQANNELRNVKSKTQQFKNQTREILEDNEKLKQRSAIYEDLIEKGFVNDQNRVTVRDSFNLMATVTQLVNANYEVSRAEVIKDKTLQSVGYNLLKSQVKVEMSAIDDVKIYNFLYLIANKYPGIANIKSLNVEKESEITAGALRRMNNAEPSPIVSGFVEFDWVTVAPFDNENGG